MNSNSCTLELTAKERASMRFKERLRADGYWWEPIPTDKPFATGWDGYHTVDWYLCMESMPEGRERLREASGQ